MTALIKTGILNIMTSECYDRYFVDFDFFHGPCMKATLSKLIGLVIVLGSLTGLCTDVENFFEEESLFRSKKMIILMKHENLIKTSEKLTEIKVEDFKMLFVLYSVVMLLINFKIVFTVKVPQILKIMQNKSGEGISLTGSILELSACTSFFAYSYLKQFPFSAWGDGLFMAIQTVAVIGLIFYYKNQSTQSIMFILSYVVLVLLTVIGMIPLSFFWLMQILNLPISILGKGAQIITNYKNQGTGQLSVITCWMQFGGCIARVFTSMQETGDAAIVLTFMVAAVLNGTVVFQIIYYSRAAEKKAKGKGKGKSKGQKSD